MPRLGNHIEFFAAGTDIENAFADAFTSSNLKMVLAGEVDENVRYYDDISSVDNIGHASGDDTNKTDSFLIVSDCTRVRIRRLNTTGGIVRHFCDQQENPDSVYFRPGGEFGTCVISGLISTIHESHGSRSIFRVLAKAFKESFTNVHGTYVGERAMALYNQGYRLTASLSAPSEYDLSP